MASRNVGRVVARILEDSHTLRSLAKDGRIAIVGAMYDIATGDIQYLSDPQGNPAPAVLASETLGSGVPRIAHASLSSRSDCEYDSQGLTDD